MAQIDFQPADIGGIERRGTDLVVRFPGQPLYDEDTHSRGVASVHHCEVVVANGHLVDAGQIRFPIRVDNLEVAYRRGDRCFHLPIGFDEDGPVEVRLGVRAENGLFSWRPFIRGSAVALRVLESVKDVPNADEP